MRKAVVRSRISYKEQSSSTSDSDTAKPRSGFVKGRKTYASDSSEKQSDEEEEEEEEEEESESDNCNVKYDDSSSG